MACAAEQSGSDEFKVDLEIHQPALDYTASSQLLLALKKKAGKTLRFNAVNRLVLSFMVESSSI
jgi:hypothetical protein